MTDKKTIEEIFKEAKERIKKEKREMEKVNQKLKTKQKE